MMSPTLHFVASVLALCSLYASTLVNNFCFLETEVTICGQEGGVPVYWLSLVSFINTNDAV